MNEKGEAYKKIMKELLKTHRRDFYPSSGRIFNSMYGQPLRIAKEAHIMFMESNLGNPGLYPGTRELEKRLVGMLGELLHCPDARGQVVSGGTEANITAMWIAKKISKKKEIVYPKSAHFSFLKAVDMMGLTPVEIKLDKNYQMDVGEAESKISSKTAAVVGVAGTTELGVIDPIEKLSKICIDRGIFLHVDAAFGGFVIPFLKDLGYSVLDFDFILDGVCSITIDPHKMGFSTLPAGALLVRKESYLPSIAVKTPYLTNESQTTIIGTRCSAGMVSAYAAMKYLGRSGYRQIVKKCMDDTFYIAREMEKMGLKLVVKPTMNILGIKAKNQKKIANDMCKLNWKIGSLDSPKCVRIVVMPHKKSSIDGFLADFERVCIANKEI